MRAAAALVLAVAIATVASCGDDDLQFGEEQDTPTPTSSSTPDTTATPSATVTPEPTTVL
jgi:hypothetical protein